MYHATPYENLGNILTDGIHPGPDGLIYMCKDPKDAVKFIAIRGCHDILVVEVKIPKRLEDTIVETFDHSERFFQCRCYASKIPIETQRLDKMLRFQL